MSKIIVTFGLVLSAFLSFGQTGGVGTYKFLELPNSARVAALGGNLISISDGDLNFSFHNPALLDSTIHNHIALNYVNYFALIKFGYAAYSHHFSRIGTFSAGIHYIDYGDFMRADEYGFRNGTFDAREYAINLIYSRCVVDSMLQVGINIKPVISNLENYTSIGIATDLGLYYYNHSALFGAALVVKNAGSQIKPYYGSHYENLPFDIQLGVSKRLAHAPFRFTLTAQHLKRWKMTYELDEDKTNAFGEEEKTPGKMEEFSDNLFRHFIVGIEFMPGKNFHARIGYNHQRRKEMIIEDKTGFTGISWGFGVKIYKFKIDYGRATYHIAGASNHFSLSTNISEFYSKKIDQNKKK